jgi:hypothetical protein
VPPIDLSILTVADTQSRIEGEVEPSGGPEDFRKVLGKRAAN